MNEFLARFQFQINILDKCLDIIYIPTSERVGNAKIDGFVDWNTLREYLEKNPKALRVSFDIGVPFQVTVVNLENNETIANGKIDLSMDWVRTFRILLEFLTSRR